MNQWLGMLSVVLAVFGVIGIGALARRINWLTEEADRSLIKLVINILIPALILSVTLTNQQLRQPMNVLLPPAVGFATVVGGFALAMLAAHLLGKLIGLEDQRQRRTFALCVGLYNYGYVPLPLAQKLFGQDTVAILFVHNIGVELALWTVGVMLVSGHLAGQWYKRVLNVPSIVIVISLILNFCGIAPYIPAFLHQSFDMLGKSAIPLALLLVGATLADQFRQARITQGARTIIAGSLLRLGLFPAGFLLLAWLLPASTQLKNVIAIEAAMPSALFPIIMARHYGGHPPTALRIVLGTGLLSLLTTPLWLLAGIKLLGLSCT
jgi:hypothetical protein